MHHYSALPTWYLVSNHRRWSCLAASHLLVVDHVTTLGDGIVYHVECVRYIGHTNHAQPNQVGLLNHHLLQNRLEKNAKFN